MSRCAGSDVRHDANGISGQSPGQTNKEQKITITASTNLSKDDIERMKKDAEANAEADKKRRESVEVKNMGETMVYTTEKMLKEAGDKAPEAERKTTEEKLEALKTALKADDIEAVKKAADELAVAAQKVGAAMYQAQQSADGSTEEKKGASDAGEGPVEGEFKAKT